MAYGVKYRLNYCNKDGDAFRLDIEIDGYSGEIFPIEGTAVPFVLTMHNSNEFPKLETIRATEATIEVYEDDNINIDSLLTSNETAIRISHYKNGSLNWQGFAVPDFYHVSIEDARVISITASDRLGALKSIGADERYGQDGIINILRRCLLKTGLKLNIKTIIGLNSTDVVLKNMPLTNLVLCDRLFNQRGEAINCYDVIKSICDMFNCFITQKDGYWWIVNKEQLELGTGEVVEYSWDGEDFEAVEVTDFSRQTIDFDFVDTGGERMVRPVLREVGILGEFGGSIAYPQNNDFRNWNGSSFPGWLPFNSFVSDVFTGNVKEYNPDRTIKDFEPGSKNKLLNRNATFEYYDTSNPNTLPYLESTAIPIVPDDAKDNKVTVEYSFNATCKNNTMLLFGLVLETPNTKNKYYVLRGSDGTWVPGGNNKNSLYGKEKEAPWYYEDILAGVLPWITSKVVNTEVDPNAAIGVNVSGSVVIDAATAVDFGQCKIYARIFGAIPLKVYSGDIRTTVIINSVNINIKSSSELPKGNLYKVTREGQFTAKTTFPVSIYSDYITGGINGYFYSYPSDDTSAMFTGWTSEREDTQVMPLLLLVARQMSYLYGEAQNQLNITIDAADVDILAIYRLACKSENYVVSKYTIDYLRGQLTLTLSEIKRPTTDGVPYIYSYFGGDDNVSTIGIGGVSSSGSVGGGAAPQGLQSVTEVGNTTTLDISVRGLRVSDFLVVPNNAPGEDDIVDDESYMWLGDGATAGIPDVGTLVGLSDVNITSPTNGQALVWNSSTSKWENATVASGGGTWGSITGVLYNQTDLMMALNGKADITHTHDASDIVSGVINIARIPTGTTAGTVALGNHTHTFAQITNKPTTITGYGITDAYTKSEVDSLVSAKQDVLVSGTNIKTINGQSILGSGNIVTPNTTYTATNGISISGSNVISPVYGTTAGTIAQGNDSRINNGQTAYSWGNHANAGYAVNGTGSTQVRNNAQLDARYMQVTAPANSITTGDIANWNTAYSQRHTHANKALLDVINQNLSTTSSVQFSGANIVDSLRIPVTAPTTPQNGNLWIGDGATAGVPDTGTLVGLSDVNITSPINGQALVWNSSTSKWENATVASGGGTWGSITGVLSNQTDLMMALNGKANVAHTHDASDIVSGVLNIARIPTGTTGSTVALGNHTHTFAQITNKPTTISGYGITDAYTKSAVDSLVSAKQNVLVSGTNIKTINGQSILGSGNIVTPNTTYTASNGIAISSSNVISPVYGTTANTIAQGNDSRIVNGQTAYSWGNHASAGYAVSGTGGTQVRNNTQLDARYMQVTAPANAITTGDINNWNTAYSQRHTHANKALLDVINQSLATTASVQFSGANIVNSLVIPIVAPATPQNGNLWIGDGATAGIPDAGTLAGLSDVNITSPTNGQALVWNASTMKWENATISSGGGTWGSITGVLSNQTDLQIALNNRELVANKATSFSVLNNTLYPTTQAVANYVGNGTLTISAGAGLTGSGSFSANQSSNASVSIGLSVATQADIAKGVTAYGWGDYRDYGLANSTIINTDWNEITGTRFFYNSAIALNAPAAFGRIAAINLQAGNNLAQLAFRTGGDNFWIRRKNNQEWSSWVELYHTGNLRSNAENDARYLQIGANAVSATKLATARNFTIGNTSKPFDGTANVSWSISEIGAIPSTHPANSITTGDISNWNTAYSQRHTHANKALLDVINQQLATSSDVVFNSVHAVNEMRIPTVTPSSTGGGYVWVGEGATPGAPSAGTLAGLEDVQLSSLTNGQSLVWNASTLKWENATISSGGGTWGSITGVLSNQTDLQLALNNRELVANKATNFGTLNNTLYPTTQAVANYVGNGTLTISAGTGLSGSGSFSANQSSNASVSIGLSASTQSDIAKGVTAYGWGDYRDYGLANSTIINTDWNEITGTRFFYNSATALNAPAAFGRTAAINLQAGNNLAQLAFRTGGDNFWIRRKNNQEWSSWVELYHTGNLRSNAENDARYLQIGAASFGGNAATATALQTARSIAMTGDVAWSVTFNGSANVTAAGTIANGAVTNAKMANMAANTFKGRLSSTGAPQDLTVAQMQSVLNIPSAAKQTAWDGAVALQHSHSNKAFLDTVNQNMGTSNTVTFDGVIATTRLRIPTSAPSNPVNGEIWIDTSS